MRQVRTRTLISDRVAPPTNPPEGPPDTFAVYFKGSNVLVDPGFENFVQMTGGWYHPTRTSSVNDYVVPYLDLTCASYLAYPNGCLTGSYPTWCQTSGPYGASGLGTDQAWKVSVGAARSGSYGGAWWNWHNGDIPPGELCPINPYLGAPFSARAEPGDQITLSFWCRAGSAPSEAFNAQGEAFVTIRFYTSNFNLLRADVGTNTVLSASWQQISHGPVYAPPNTTYVRACFGFFNLGQFATYVDDAALAVL